MEWQRNLLQMGLKVPQRGIAKGVPGILRKNLAHRPRNSQHFKVGMCIHLPAVPMLVRVRVRVRREEGE